MFVLSKSSNSTFFSSSLRQIESCIDKTILNISFILNAAFSLRVISVYFTHFVLSVSPLPIQLSLKTVVAKESIPQRVVARCWLTVVSFLHHYPLCNYVEKEKLKEPSRRKADISSDATLIRAGANVCEKQPKWDRIPWVT